MTNHPFDSQIRQKMKEHEAAVPAGTWEAISEKKKKRRHPFFWWLSGLGVVAIGILIGTANRQPTAPAVSLSGNELPVQKTSNTTSLRDTFTTPPSAGQTNLTTAERRAMKDIADKYATAKTKRYNRGSHSNLPAQGRPATASLQRPSSPMAVTIQPARIDASSAGITGTKAGTGSPVTAIPGNASIAATDTPATPFITTGDRNDIRTDTSATTPASGEIVQKEAQQRVTATDTTAAAASKPIQQVKQPRWSVEISVSPFLPLRQQQSLAFVNRTISGAMYTSVFKADQIKAVLQPSFSYTILAHRTLGKRLQLGTGLQYSLIKEKLELAGTEINTQYQVLQRLENNTSTPFLRSDTVAVVSSGLRTIRAINSYRSFDIPLSVRYTVMKKPRFTLQLTGAVSLGVYYRYHNAIEGKTEAISAAGVLVSRQPSSFRTGLSTGFRYSRLVWKRTAVFAEPYLHISTGNYTDALINRPVHRAGIGLGASFRF